MWNKKLELTSCIPQRVLRHYLLRGILAAFCFESTWASEYLVNSWSAEDGLPQNTVTCITQTRDGYLWLGTLNGVARFDGIRFVVFGAHNTSELKSNRILALVEDREGGLWIGTEGGGVTRLHLGRFVTLTTWDGLPSNIVQGLQEDASGRIWIRTQAGMCVWRRGAFLPVVASEAPLEEALRDVALPTASVGVVKRLSDGQLWAGTQEGGLLCFRNGHWANIPSPSEAGRHPVRCLFEDREKNLWVGTDGGGLVQLKPRRLLTLDARDGLPNEFILSMAEDGAGGLWLSASGGGISQWRQGAPPVPWPASGPLHRNATIGPLLRARDGSLWVGTSGEGLFQWKNGETQLFGRSQGLPNPAILSLLEDRDGRLWIGTYADGLFLYQDGRFVNFGVKEGFPARNITAIVQDRDGDIWIGSNGMGLYRYADGRFSYYCRREGWGSDFIRTLLVDKEGALWIGSGGSGLTRMKDGWFHTVTTRQGLDDDVISQIMEDDFGYLWIGSNRGIFRLSKQLFESFAAGRRTSVEGIAYGKSEGMQSLECTGGYQPAGLKARDGSLWFSTVKGAVRIDPSMMAKTGASNAVTQGRLFNDLPPPVVVEGVWVDDEQVLTAGADWRSASRLEVRPGQNRVEIRYTALSFTAPEKVRFRHRLVGLDPAWVEANDNRVARYAKLPPGEYCFEVIACNNDGVWNRQGTSLPLRIVPYFWQTGWFLALAGVLTVAMVIGAVRAVVVRRMRHKLEQLRQRHALETERARIARDIHDDLGARLTKISLLSSLTERDLSDPRKAAEHIGEISSAVREVTTSLDEVVWAVEPTNDTLDNLATYLCQYAEEYLGGTAVRCRLNVPALLPAVVLSSAVRHDVFMVVKEALNNVAKHAQATTAWLSLSFERGRLTLSVEDDGRGFDAATVERGNGLENMSERLRRLGGEIRFENRPEGGSRVAFSIPL
jgi:ligand-binding sensor domain-containing protein/signal transduction histidine kinase